MKNVETIIQDVSERPIKTLAAFDFLYDLRGNIKIEEKEYILLDIEDVIKDGILSRRVRVYHT